MSTRGELLLEASGVEVEIAGNRILEGVDLNLSRGELVAVVGPNGAGKSTFARAACGLQKATAGRIEWEGRPIGELKGRELASVRAFIPQRPQVPAGVTVDDAVESTVASWSGATSDVDPLPTPCWSMSEPRLL